jgi:hypothetical protein
MNAATCPAGEAQSYNSLAFPSRKSSHLNSPNTRAGWRSGKRQLSAVAKSPLRSACNHTHVICACESSHCILSAITSLPGHSASPALRSPCPAPKPMLCEHHFPGRSGAHPTVLPTPHDHPRLRTQAERAPFTRQARKSPNWTTSVSKPSAAASGHDT